MIRLKVLLAWLPVLLAAGWLALRGPLRARTDYVNDFASPYVSARLWMAHQNPYALSAFFPTWQAAGAPLGPVYANPSNIRSVYPPSSIVAVIPFALLPWPVASKSLLLLSVALYLTALILMASFVTGDWSQPVKPLFLAFGLALAPVHSAIHVSNVACLAASLLFIAIYLILRPPAFSDRNPASTAFVAALIAYSLCLKPTLAPLILLYLLWARLWRTLVVTLYYGMALSALSLYPLFQRGKDWLIDLRNNIHFGHTSGSVDVTPANLARFDRLDLQVPLYALTQSRTAAFVLAVLITATLLALWFRIPTAVPRVPNRVPDTDEHLLRIATLFVIGILPFYQRFYSAILLLIPLLWAFRQLARPPQPARSRIIRTTAQAAFATAALFLVNTEVLIQQTRLVPAGAHNLPLVANAFLGPHLCWLLLCLGCLLLAALSAQSRPKLAPSQPPQL
jgi:hypothetical protein